MAIIGGPDAGKVDWHPSVVTEARKTGLSVDDDGNLIFSTSRRLSVVVRVEQIRPPSESSAA